jgi:hypothetical protein
LVDSLNMKPELLKVNLETTGYAINNCPPFNTKNTKY